MISSLEDMPAVAKYLRRIDAQATGLFAATIKETVQQYWVEKVRIKFSRTGDVTVTKGKEAYMPTSEEAEAIRAAFQTAILPSCVYQKNPEWPDELKKVDPESVFVFLDERGNTLMLQQRIETPNGKLYLPWSNWSDGCWRRAEPDVELLPLWGLDTIAGNTTAFVSEGAKAGRAVARLINPKTKEEKEAAEAFPWKEQFAHAASVAYIGGALSPERTDFGALKRLGITRVILVCDNDSPGTDSVAKISSAIDLPCYAIRFTDEWPRAFDLADPWPDDLFREIKGKKYYVGPSYFDCLSPATYLTKMIEVETDSGKKKKVAVLRHHAKEQWLYAEGQGVFINVDFPQMQLPPGRLDAILRPFSDTPVVSELLLQEFSCRIDKIAYKPGTTKRKIMVDGELALNLYQPPQIPAYAGDITPFLEYLEYLVPGEEDRKQLLRWMATLVSKPATRLLYGVLMISETTGVGKTILAEQILAPLVGMSNTSFPSESTILEQFNSWLAKKRLVIVAELYQGSSWKMTNKLKSFITDTKVIYREMYRDPVVIDNYATFFCSSNSTEPLKLDEKDRRWLVPQVTEVRWPDEKFSEFLDWLASGGLSIIKHFFDHFKDYVRPGEKAPASIKKSEIIESGKSSAVNRLGDLAFKISEIEVAIGDRDCHDWLELVTGSKAYETLLEIRKYLKEKGMTEAKVVLPDSRMFYNSKQQTVLLSQKLLDKVSNMGEDADVRSYIKERLKVPAEIMNNVQM